MDKKFILSTEARVMKIRHFGTLLNFVTASSPFILEASLFQAFSTLEEQSNKMEHKKNRMKESSHHER